MRSLDQRLVGWGILGIAAATIAAAVGWISVQLWAPEPSPTLPSIEAHMHLDAPRLTHGYNGTILWELEGIGADYDREQDALVVQGPRIRYHRPDGTVLALADKGTVWQKRGEAELVGNLTIELHDGTITASRMRYTETDARIVFPEGLRLRATRLHLDAPWAQLFLSEERITASGGIQATIYP